MSTIESVQARTVAVPLDEPTAFSTRLVTERHYTLVRIRTTDGVQGIGFCYAGDSGGQVVSGSVRELIAPVLEGEASHRVRGLWDMVHQATLLQGRAGTTMRALSAADIALWDANARAVNLPLWQYLGAVAETTVPAYASGGYYRDGKTPQDLAQEVAGYVELGFDAVKIKVGRASISQDAERIAAARDAIGPDVKLMLDANNAWGDLPSALAALEVWKESNPFWIEEPFAPDAIHNHARLAQKTSIAVATGEIEAGLARHVDLLKSEAAIILQTDAAVCGGITEFQAIAATARSFGVEMWPHWFHDLHVHLVASTSNAGAVEFFADSSVLNFRRLITEQLEVSVDGSLVLPHRPGLGFDFDESVVGKFALDDWA